jgi:hypothetical protein
VIQFLVEAMELRIPTEEKFLAVCISDRAGTDGVFTFSQEQLSRDTSMSAERLGSAMDWLIEHGIVELTFQFIDDIRYQQERRYRLLLPSTETPRYPNFTNCPSKLRDAVILNFAEICSYCDGRGDSTVGPDGAPWSVDRIIPGAHGGLYVAGNVTLACKSCNSSKGSKVGLTARSLATVIEESELVL